MFSRRTLGLGALVCASGALGTTLSRAAGDFYRGKTINLVVGYPPGGANDVYSRLLAQRLGEYIPGHPSIVVQNMPGAGSFVAVNTIYNIAPKDGLTMGLGAPTLALDERLGTSGVHFKTAQLNWIGRLNPLINIVMTWKTCPVTTIAEAEKTPVTLGGTGAGSTVSIYPQVLNKVLGTKFKLIMGYAGSRDAMLAMERGEVQGHSTAWEAVKEAHPDWIRDKAIHILVQFALKRSPELADVPTAVELGRNDEERSILSAIMSASEIGESFFTSPGVPPERVAILRSAFARAARDPALLAEAKTAKIGIDPLAGTDVQKLVASIANLTPGLLAKVKAAFPVTG